MHIAGRRAGFGAALLHIIHEEKRAINQGWKAQPGCNQQVKPHALPLALQWISPDWALNRVRKLAGNGSVANGLDRPNWAPGGVQVARLSAKLLS
jgi:hypothetical protein